MFDVLICLVFLYGLCFLVYLFIAYHAILKEVKKNEKE